MYLPASFPFFLLYQPLPLAGKSGDNDATSGEGLDKLAVKKEELLVGSGDRILLSSPASLYDTSFHPVDMVRYHSIILVFTLYIW